MIDPCGLATATKNLTIVTLNDGLADCHSHALAGARFNARSGVFRVENDRAQTAASEARLCLPCKASMAL
jgi:hypothetical protein